MKFKYPKTEGITEPLKTLIEGNADTYQSLFSVIASFEDKNLEFKSPHNSTRTISEIVQHTLDCQINFYLNKLVLKKESSFQCSKPETVENALNEIQKVHDEVVSLLNTLVNVDLEEIISTEWGQSFSKKVAIFQSIWQLGYHTSEICFLAGIGGFYKGVLG
jgi:hypothetical protein